MRRWRHKSVDMFGFENLGRILILTGIFIAIVGLLLAFWSKIPFLGKLPGDIFLQKGNFRFIFPVAACLIISAVLTVVANLVIRLLGK